MEREWIQMGAGTKHRHSETLYHYEYVRVKGEEILRRDHVMGRKYVHDANRIRDYLVYSRTIGAGRAVHDTFPTR